MEGTKYDEGKVKYRLIPPIVLERIAKVLTFGANKYEEGNWQYVEVDRYLDALFRHIQAWRLGEDYDKESGFHHLDHALTNLLFINVLVQNKSANTPLKPL